MSSTARSMLVPVVVFTGAVAQSLAPQSQLSPELRATDPAAKLMTTSSPSGSNYLLSVNNSGTPELFSRSPSAPGWMREEIPKLAQVPAGEFLSANGDLMLYAVDGTDLVEFRVSRTGEHWERQQVSGVAATGQPCALSVSNSPFLFVRDRDSGKRIVALKKRGNQWVQSSSPLAFWQDMEDRAALVCGMVGRDLALAGTGSDGTVLLATSRDRGDSWMFEKLPNGTDVRNEAIGSVALTDGGEAFDVFAISKRGELIRWSASQEKSQWKFETVQVSGAPVLEGSLRALSSDQGLFVVARTTDRRIAIFEKRSRSADWKLDIVTLPQSESVAHDLQLLSHGRQAIVLARSESGNVFELESDQGNTSWSIRPFQPVLLPPPPPPAPPKAPPTTPQASESIQICVDRPVVGNPLPPRQMPENPPTIATDGSLIHQKPQELAGLTDKMWDIGQTLRVAMVGGTPYVQAQVRRFAQEWTQYANIRFEFVDPEREYAQIRITFEPGGSWSRIGRDSLGDAQWTWSGFNRTMNFGWFNDSTPDDEFRRTVLHEFGHALGLVHEHQSPASGIQWDREKAYEFYWKDQGWDHNMVDLNVFRRYEVTTTNYSQYDSYSIMHYDVPASITLDGKGTQVNWELSETDKEYIRRWYPFPPTPENAVGLLRTGDDCDEIDFRVEYGVIDSSLVQFNLSAPTRIDWWKAIEVPTQGGGFTMLQIQDRSRASHDMAVSQMDTSRAMRFWKAKEFGVHRRLGYTWNVLDAIPGGTRVSLFWKRDKCW